jgi:hypothetical protein
MRRCVTVSKQKTLCLDQSQSFACLFLEQFVQFLFTILKTSPVRRVYYLNLLYQPSVLPSADQDGIHRTHTKVSVRSK